MITASCLFFPSRPICIRFVSSPEISDLSSQRTERACRSRRCCCCNCSSCRHQVVALCCPCARGRQGDLVAGFRGGSRVESLTMEGTNLRLGGSGWDPVEETQGREGRRGTSREGHWVRCVESALPPLSLSTLVHYVSSLSPSRFLSRRPSAPNRDSRLRRAEHMALRMLHACTRRAEHGSHTHARTRPHTARAVGALRVVQSP